MIRLIIGKKGSGKTKTLIELVRSTLETTNGAVVCIEKGDKLTYDIPYQCRLVDADKYLIADGQSLFGFVAGSFGDLDFEAFNFLFLCFDYG